MESPDNRRKADDSYRTLCVGRSLFLPAASTTGTRMAGIPNALAIALWIVGSCWAIAALAWLLNAETDFLTLLVAFGAVTGTLEWWLRRKS